MAKKPNTIETPTPTETVATSISWGEGTDQVSANIAALPNTTLVALMQKGFTHVMGNEVASALTGEKKRRAEKSEPALTADEEKAYSAEKRVEKLKAMLDGTMGARAGGGTRLPTIERYMRDIAEARVRADAAKGGIKLPKGKETIKVRDEMLTMAELITRRVAKQEADIRAEAARRMESEQSGDVTVGVDDLI
jgi:hypothetical protein